MPTASLSCSATFAAVAACIVLALSSVAVAGPLNPPAGPVAPTPGPEPRTAINDTNTPGDAGARFKITQPGSYYLTGNITGVAGKHGIDIATSGVTIDLNGFEVAGVPGSFSGIRVVNIGTERTTIRNGTVRSWGGTGVACDTINYGGSIEGVTATLNGSSGIAVGNAWTVTRCAANQNGGNGIVAFSASVVVSCESRANSGSGFSVSFGVLVSQCVAASNTSAGFESAFNDSPFDRCSAYANSVGFTLKSRSTVSDCSALNNTTDGIVAADRCMIRGNNCANNGNSGDGAGIHITGTDNRIEGNNCTGADRGIDVDSGGNFIVRNTCSGNTTNWDLAANNTYGPILDRSAIASSAVNGSSGPGSLGTSEANANFTY